MRGTRALGLILEWLDMCARVSVTVLVCDTWEWHVAWKQYTWEWHVAKCEVWMWTIHSHYTFHFHIWHYQPYNPQTPFWDGEKISGDKKDKMRTGSTYLFISWSENILDKNSLKGCRVDSGKCEVWMWRYGRWHVACPLSQVFGLSQVFLGTEIDNLMGTFFLFAKCEVKKYLPNSQIDFCPKKNLGQWGKPGTPGVTRGLSTLQPSDPLSGW